MIKEFWNERKEEKKRLKQLKKQNRKTPKTGEQKAYKVFGFLFATFLIFVAGFYACGGSSDDGFTWESMVGITSELKSQLNTPIAKSELITNKQIDAIDWSYCKDDMTAIGLGNLIVDDNIDTSILLSQSEVIDGTFSLSNGNLGALAYKLIEKSISASTVELIEVILFEEDGQLKLTSLCQVELSSVVIGGTLPSIYVTTTSNVTILNNQMFCINSTMKINKLSDEDNAKILEIIDNSSFTGLEYYTNELIARQINSFRDGVGGIVRIKNLNLELTKK